MATARVSTVFRRWDPGSEWKIWNQADLSLYGKIGKTWFRYEITVIWVRYGITEIWPLVKFRWKLFYKEKMGIERIESSWIGQGIKRIV